MKRNNYQFTDLPVIDAGDSEQPSPASRPLLWVLVALLAASAAVSVWVTRAGQPEPDLADSPAPVAPSAKEKEKLLGSLSESTSQATEDERLAALADLSADAAVPIEEMQEALSHLSERGEE